MSKTNDTAKLRIEDAFTLDLNSVTTFTVREFRDDELEKVSGGVKTVSWGYDDESPKETVTFEYGGIQVHYTPQKPF